MKSRYGLEIRSATGADAVGVNELLAAVGHAVPVRDLADRLDAVRAEPGAALIAVEWGPPSGLVLAHWYRTLLVDHPTAQITTLMVGPDERRRGIGRLLIKAVAQAARVAGCDALEVLAAGDEIAAFCRATGFAETQGRFTRGLRKKAGPDG